MNQDLFKVFGFLNTNKTGKTPKTRFLILRRPTLHQNVCTTFDLLIRGRWSPLWTVPFVCSPGDYRTLLFDTSLLEPLIPEVLRECTSPLGSLGPRASPVFLSLLGCSTIESDEKPESCSSVALDSVSTSVRPIRNFLTRVVSRSDVSGNLPWKRKKKSKNRETEVHKHL